MVTKDNDEGVNVCTVPGTVTLSVLLVMVMVQLPGEPAKTCPLVAPKLQIFKLFEPYVVRGSVVMSRVVLPSIRLTFQLNCVETLGNRTLVVRLKEGGART